MKEVKVYTVLIAPLDWGLGHATRCIPLIRALYARGFKVIIASDGLQRRLLEMEFPQLEFVCLKGYNMLYGKDRTSTKLKLLWQIPKFFKAIRRENNWVKDFVKECAVDMIISDNRYGFYHPDILSVMITHQLNIITNNAFTESIVRKLHYRLLKPFDYCWVPDFCSPDNLAGRLSNPDKLPALSTRYIGWLSRFGTEGKLPTELTCKYDGCIILSGPEPQRTLLEEKIVQQLKDCPYKIVLVRGLPESSTVLKLLENTISYNHLPGKELLEVVAASKYVLCRGGYTSLMEMIGLGKKLILIPTPAQTEQEHLAKVLQDKQWALTMKQEEFNLTEALQQAELFDYHYPSAALSAQNHLREDAIDELLTVVSIH